MNTYTIKVELKNGLSCEIKIKALSFSDAHEILNRSFPGLVFRAQILTEEPVGDGSPV